MVSPAVRLGSLLLCRGLVLSHNLRSLSLRMVNGAVLVVSWSKGAGDSVCWRRTTTVGFKVHEVAMVLLAMIMAMPS